MRAVGIRELKNRLSHYVRLVEKGEEVLVTDRGRVVAAMTRPGVRLSSDEVPHPLEQLAREGRIALGGPNDPDLYPRLPSTGDDGLSRRLLDEGRGER